MLTNNNSIVKTKDKIINIINNYSPELAAEEILLLFGVMKSDCEHEWINHSFDQFGFLQEQICDKCGAKQFVS